MNNIINGDSTGFTQKEFDNIKLCLETLLSVEAGTQPMDREFGISYNDIVGYPAPVASNMLVLEISEKVERYEPRVSIRDINVIVDGEKLTVSIYFIKREG